jgi:cold shock CspA family protein
MNHLNGGPPASAGQQRNGVIVFVSPEKNYAFITSQKQTKIYLHNSQFRSGDCLKLGKKVQFRLALSSKGGWRAEDCIRQEQANYVDPAKFSSRPAAFLLTDSTHRSDRTYSSICSNGSKSNIEISSDKTIDDNKSDKIKSFSNSNKNQIDNNVSANEKKFSHLSAQPPFNDSSKLSGEVEKVVSASDIESLSSSGRPPHNNTNSLTSLNSSNVWNNMTIFKNNLTNNDNAADNIVCNGIKIDNNDSNKSNKLPVPPIFYMKKEYGDLMSPVDLGISVAFYDLCGYFSLLMPYWL